MIHTFELSTSEKQAEHSKDSSTEIFFTPEAIKPMTPAEMARLAAIRDKDIDYSDIPQLDDDFPQKAVRGLMYRPVTQP